MANETTPITAQCLCKAHTFTTTVPSTSLPLQASCCHCDSCRHQTGALYFVCVEWPNRDEDLTPLRKYSFSANTDIFFCPTCSSPMFCRGTRPGDAPLVTTGVLPNLPDLVEYASHIFVADTLDGGASVWLRRKTNPDGDAMPRWGRRPDDDARAPSAALPLDWPRAYTAAAGSDIAAATADDDDGPSPASVPLRCHCGGVDLVLRSAADMAALPADSLPWFVDPRNHKYLATMDACDSCRLSFGVDLPCWVFAGLDHIDFPAAAAAAPQSETAPDGTPPPPPSPLPSFPRTVSALKSAVTVAAASQRDGRLGTLTLFNSSPDVERYFCGRCAACVFYAVHGRPDMVDVAAGLLRHPDGARAEGLLAWGVGGPGGVGFTGDTKGGWREALADGANAQAEAWRRERGYPMSWRRTKREEKAAGEAAGGR